LDTAALGSAVINATGRHTHFAAKEEFWEGPYPRITGTFVGLGGGHPVKRRGHLEDQPKLLERGQEIARSGELWVIYYNGTRVDQSEPIIPRRVKTGPILLSKMLDIPIVPVGVAGIVEKDHMTVSFQEAIPPDMLGFEMEDIENASGLRDVSALLTPARILFAERAQAAKTRAEVLRKNNLSK
jgi:hypothetical protein